MVFFVTLFLFLVGSLVSASPLVHTYSIIARDERTGQIGVGVQSHWFAVGSCVPWAKAGTGAVATQAMTNARFGPSGLKMLSLGMNPRDVLARLLADDALSNNRQVAVIGRQGLVAAHTGENCIDCASHMTGNSFSVQANMMANSEVVPAMARAYKNSKGELSRRILAALQAAEAAGGDMRGAQSAALKVVSSTQSFDPWKDIVVDIRVDDHRKPLVELERLLNVSIAYRYFGQVSSELSARRYHSADLYYRRAVELAPRKVEFSFWYALKLAVLKQWARAIPLFQDVFQSEPLWKDVLLKLPGSSAVDLSYDECTVLIGEIERRCIDYAQ